MSQQPDHSVEDEGGDSPVDAEHELAALVDEVTQQLASGATIDPEQLCEAYPAFAEQLMDLWPAIVAAAAVAGEAPMAHASTDTPAYTLPHQFGDYILQEEIGRGGMGVIFRAEQISLQREVALKLLLRGQFALPHERARFRREAQSAAGLTHPAIVPVFEVGEHDRQMYLSMQLIAGSTLDRRLQRGPLPPRRAARMMATIARGVDYAHQKGVLHRDLKPANVLIDEDGAPHVSDFGLALPLEDTRNMTRTGAVVGTPAYMAPEQMGSQDPRNTPASDIYSLGAILYHMLTGDKPFPAATPVDTVMMVLERDPLPVRVLNRRVHRDLEMITMHCLQKPVELRYESAAALADDLEAFLDGEPINARSGRVSHIISRLFRETHHAPILETWGVIWMWHSLVLLCVAILTHFVATRENTNRWTFFLLWAAGISAWGVVYWGIRRRAGPVSFVERQIAHAWAAAIAMILLIIPLEAILELPPLQLTPIIAGSIGMVFIVKAGTLSGTFYLQAGLMFLAALGMAIWPQWAQTIFGCAAASCFFFPGWRYHRQRKQRERENLLDADANGEW